MHYWTDCLPEGWKICSMCRRFVTTVCPSGLTCQVLPLVNSPGISVTCDTPADTAARIAATGAKRSLSFLIASEPVDSEAPFTQINVQAARTLQAAFNTLTENSSCIEGENVCLQDGRFARCSGGSLIATPCARGLTCQALPLPNSVGTTVTCDRTPGHVSGG